MTEKKSNSYDTRDLGCASFLYAHRFKLSHHVKNGAIFLFTFTETEEKTGIEKAVDDYYGNDPIPVIDFWNAIRSLKTLIHERR